MEHQFRTSVCSLTSRRLKMRPLFPAQAPPKNGCWMRTLPMQTGPSRSVVSPAHPQHLACTTSSSNTANRAMSHTMASSWMVLSISPRIRPSTTPHRWRSTHPLPGQAQPRSSRAVWCWPTNRPMKFSTCPIKLYGFPTPLPLTVHKTSPRKPTSVVHGPSRST